MSTDTRQRRSAAIVLHGRKVVGGWPRARRWSRATRISGWGGIHARDGTVIERRHELSGDELRGQGAGVPRRQGLVGLVRLFHMARLNGAPPGA